MMKFLGVLVVHGRLVFALTNSQRTIIRVIPELYISCLNTVVSKLSDGVPSADQRFLRTHFLNSVCVCVKNTFFIFQIYTFCVFSINNICQDFTNARN
jgi:hypothetical protein